MKAILPKKGRLLTYAINALDQRLAGIIRRVRLSCKNDLHRPLRMVEQPLEPLLILKNERCAFVRGEATGESQGQSIRIEHEIDLR